MLARLLISFFVPSSLLVGLLFVGKMVGYLFSKTAGNLLESVFGVLLFWPLGIYQAVMPEPVSSWEGFWNMAMAPCAIVVLLFYIIVTFIVLGKTQYFRRQEERTVLKKGKNVK
jgi:hypothetical protein